MALAAALFQNCLWLAGRITGSRSLGELFGAHFQSPSIRIYVLFVLFLFAVPLAATLLGSAGELLAQMSGAQSRAPWPSRNSRPSSFSPPRSADGALRSTSSPHFRQSALVLSIFSAAFAGLAFDGLSIFQNGFVVRDGLLGNVLPGVIQLLQRNWPGSPCGRAVDYYGRSLVCSGRRSVRHLSSSFGFLRRR